MATCKSCDEKDATPRECGLDLCDVCHIWVTSSLGRTRHLFTVRQSIWQHILAKEEPELLTKVKEELQELRLNEEVLEEGLEEFADDWAPHSEDAWLRYFRWLLGDEHELFKKMKLHVDMRAEAATNGISSVAEIADDLNAMAAVFIDARVTFENEASKNDILREGDTPFIPEPTTRMFGTHLVRMDIDYCMVDGISSYHCRRNQLHLAQFLFDSMNGLDTRAFDWHGWVGYRVEPIRGSRARWPETPILQEHIGLLSKGYPDRRIGDRHRAALVLWHKSRHMEFLTRDVSAWARSFQLLRSVIESSPYVELEDSEISVRGRSGTKWQIHAWRSNSRFRVTRYDVDEAICIHAARECEGYPMGDIVVSVVQMLLDDINTSETVETLVPHMRQPDGDGEEE